MSLLLMLMEILKTLKLLLGVKLHNKKTRYISGMILIIKLEETKLTCLKVGVVAV